MPAKWARTADAGGPLMNNMVEQDHRFVKKRVVASQWCDL
jgi:transposase-like protein